MSAPQSLSDSRAPLRTRCENAPPPTPWTRTSRSRGRARWNSIYPSYVDASLSSVHGKRAKARTRARTRVAARETSRTSGEGDTHGMRGRAPEAASAGGVVSQRFFHRRPWALRGAAGRAALSREAYGIGRRAGARAPSDSEARRVRTRTSARHRALARAIPPELSMSMSRSQCSRDQLCTRRVERVRGPTWRTGRVVYVPLHSAPAGPRASVRLPVGAL